MWSLVLLVGCRTEGVLVDTAALTEEEPGECFVHVERDVDGLRCTLIEEEDGTPVLWYGRDVAEGHPLAIRLRASDPDLVEALTPAAEAWNDVLEVAGVLLAYEVEQVADGEVSCRLDGIEDLPDQVAGFCVATEAEWAAEVPAEHQEHAYVTRLNSPCDGTLRGSMTPLHPLWAGVLTEQVAAKALGHLTSVVEIEADAALMAEHWDGASLPVDEYEGTCAGFQYSLQETG